MGFPPHFAQLQFSNNMPRVPLSMPSVPAQDPPVSKPAEPTTTPVKQPERPKPPQEQPPLPKEEEPKLPPHWRTAKDSEGKTYFYHALTRETQWDPPTADTVLEKKVETILSPVAKKKKREVKKSEDMMEIESPVKEAKKEVAVKKEPLTDRSFNSGKAGADESSKKALALFKNQLAKVVVSNLGKYNKVDCKVGRIMDSSDFKYLARKLTHGLTEKEMQRKAVEELSISDSLKQRVKLYIHSYMEKFGPIYHRT